jgi:hypothetical protein
MVTQFTRPAKNDVVWFAQRRPRAAGEHVNPRDHERRPAETATPKDCLEQATPNERSLEVER